MAFHRFYKPTIYNGHYYSARLKPHAHTYRYKGYLNDYYPLYRKRLHGIHNSTARKRGFRFKRGLGHHSY